MIRVVLRQTDDVPFIEFAAAASNVRSLPRTSGPLLKAVAKLRAAQQGLDATAASR